MDDVNGIEWDVLRIHSWNLMGFNSFLVDSMGFIRTIYDNDRKLYEPQMDAPSQEGGFAIH